MQVVRVQRRISVRQHVEDKNQEDNPNAEFLADEANHTDKQTQARITSTDQNDPSPNPGMQHMGPSSDPGNAHVNDLAQSDEAPGDPEKAFSESPKDGEDERVEQQSKQAKTEVDPTKTVFGEAQAAAKGKQSGSSSSTSASKERTARQERVAQEASPRLLESPAGSHAVAPERQAQAAQQARSARRYRPTPKGNGGTLPSLRGRESLGLTPGGLNPNLTPLTALSAIGQDQLNKERLADGERRRSKHRGSWRPVGLDRWKSAIENYVATVQPGNQTSLNTARAPFASYLNRIHNRLHEVFAFRFLGSLDNLPADHALNRRDLKTHLEIVLSREDGRVVKMGVTRASGSTAFDVGALESVQRASPFGAPPREIVSPDGNVYLHWEFHRDPIYACSTYFAHPFILRVSPTPAPLPPPGPPARPREGEQHGLRQTPKPTEREDG
jgi:TonB family protein